MGGERVMAAARRGVGTVSRGISLKLARSALRFLQVSERRVSALAPVRKVKPGRKLLRPASFEVSEAGLAGRPRVLTRQNAAFRTALTTGKVERTGLRRAALRPGFPPPPAKGELSARTALAGRTIYPPGLRGMTGGPGVHAPWLAPHAVLPWRSALSLASISGRRAMPGASGSIRKAGGSFTGSSNGLSRRAFLASILDKVSRRAPGSGSSFAAKVFSVPRQWPLDGTSLPRGTSGLQGVSLARRGRAAHPVSPGRRREEVRSLAPRFVAQGRHEGLESYNQSPQRTAARQSSLGAGSSTHWPGVQPHGASKAEIGRSVSELLAAEARKPPWGIAAFDSRSAPIWPGRKPAF